MDDTDTAAVSRLANGIPLHAAIDTSDAAAWMRLDLAVRERAGTRPSTLPRLSWATGRRLRWSWDAPLPTLDLRPREPDKPAIAVALCHADGRIREAALRHAGRLPAPALLPLLPLVAIRCADWAEPVRDVARDLLRSALPTLGPETIDVLAAVILRAAARRYGEPARALLEAALREGPAPVLDAVLVSRDRATRRLAHRIAVERRHLSPERLSASAAADPDVVIQDICATGAVAGATPENKREILAPLLRSAHGRVRAAGVTALRRAGRPEDAEAFLADRSSLVRACARYVLRQSGVEPAPLYRALCSGEAVPARAPLGLAECGTREDVVLLWPLTEHPLPGVRAHAVAGLRVLEAPGALRLLTLLDDPAPRVVRETVTALLPWAERLPVDELRARLGTENPGHVRVGAFRLLAAVCADTELGEIAWPLLDDDEPKLRAHARATLCC
ncbi:hypothetical protein AQF52_1560 [Streptomyces venezuelae]|uniref:hypothetical protein n=1 Tax=Streptomyces gardneri TaxID=66892 RepID=UPI0006BDE38C|nr:hypothetical protein [Streptomyces gardneri]ALO07156.1 hypothetical protein AQF52_1560 [Streptomyces venezuelae]QPK44511.1 hypothetical protein H4W23_07755 [Streptomyces gardneri]WRK35809.1 hypothetical protein U0M97_07790 [Streptomyces venezuelae]CUM42535.1 hypothetical protein BN2537_14035 [Streptomyces venezuelae]